MFIFGRNLHSFSEPLADLFGYQQIPVEETVDPTIVVDWVDENGHFVNPSA